MNKRIAILRRASGSLRRIAKHPVPELSAAASQEVLDHYSRSYSRSLDRASRQCTQLANKWERDIARARKKGLSSEIQMSFNLQYLQLQNAMQNENRQYTMISNIMKTKHDTVKNAIDNIR